MPVQVSNWPYLLLLPPIWLLFIVLDRRTLTDLPRRRRRLALLLRCVLSTLIVLALAGTRLVRSGQSLAVVFLVDASSSDASEGRAAEEYVRSAARGMRSGDRVGAITFAETPENRSPLAWQLDAGPLGYTGVTAATDIAQALRAAANELNSAGRESGKRIVLISDGDETAGNALAEAPRLAGDHVLLDTWVISPPPTNEALVDRVTIPGRVKIGEPFRVQVVVTSTVPQDASLALNREGKPVADARAVQLHVGKNVVSFEQMIEKAGFYRYSVNLRAPLDTIAENNRGEGYVSVSGRPSVLYVADSPALTSFLRNALRSQNVDVDYAAPDALPSNPAGLQRYDSVFLSNVRADYLSGAQMLAIQIACRDFGVGFGMIGGVDSFGAGGYMGTPIEETLPVSMQVKQQKRIPSSAVALVIEDLEIPATVNMSIEAAKATLDYLEPIDQVGVLDCQGFGGFGGTSEPASPSGTWRIPMQHVVDREALKEKIQSLTDMGDPPTYEPFLMEAARVLNTTDAKVKHIVFLGDGDAIGEANQGALLNDLKRLRGMGVTLSTIASGADAPGIRFMSTLAYIGGGQAYVADQPQDLPRLLLKDQQTITQPPIVEEPFQARPRPGDEILTGIDWASAPPLLGYNVSTPKPTSDVSLTSHRDDPIFVAWRYGLGRSVAFLSDDRAKWGAAWVGWPGYAKFWAQAVRWTLRPFTPNDYSTQVTLEGSRGHIVVDAVDAHGRFVNQLKLKALVAPPLTGVRSRDPMSEPVLQTGPGRYEGWFDAPATGTYLVNIVSINPNGSVSSTIAGLSSAYPAEFRTSAPNRFLMNQLATATGGRADPPPDTVFGGDRPSVSQTTDLTDRLLLFALLLLPFDVAVRRLAIDWSTIRRRSSSRQAIPREGAATPELSRLQRAKREATREPVPTAGRPVQPTVQSTRAHPRPVAEVEPGATNGEDKPEPISKPPESEMSRLMAAKRRAREREREDRGR